MSTRHPSDHPDTHANLISSHPGLAITATMVPKLEHRTEISMILDKSSRTAKLPILFCYVIIVSETNAFRHFRT